MYFLVTFKYFAAFTSTFSFINWRICSLPATWPNRSQFLENSPLHKKQLCLKWTSEVFAIDPGKMFDTRDAKSEGKLSPLLPT